MKTGWVSVPLREGVICILIALSLQTLRAVDKVLVLSESVTGGAGSLEAQDAAALGYQVDVKDATWWGDPSRTTADFAAYRAIIIGDPNCDDVNSTPYQNAMQVVESTVNIWGPAVKGNVIVIGTDPVFHSAFGVQGAADLIVQGINFSLVQPGKTGFYITLSCRYINAPANTPVPILSPFGAFTIAGMNAGADVETAHIVETQPILFGLTDEALSNWGESVHEVIDSWPNDFQVLAIAKNFDSGYQALDGTVGEPYILARGSLCSEGCSTPPVLSGGVWSNPTHIWENATFTFNITGTPGSRWDVYSSIYPTSNGPWTRVGSVELANGSATFSETGVNDQHYYKVVGCGATSDVYGFTQLRLPIGNNLAVTWAAYNPGPGSYNFVLDQQPSTLNSVFPATAISDALGNLLPQTDSAGDWWGGVFVDVAGDNYDHIPDDSGTSWEVTAPLDNGPALTGDQISFSYGDTIWFNFPSDAWIQYQDSDPVLLTWVGHYLPVQPPPPPPAPTLSNGKWENPSHIWENARFSFTITGQAGTAWDIYSSLYPNDTGWTYVGTVILVNGTATFSESDVNDQHFYKATKCGVSSTIYGFTQARLPLGDYTPVSRPPYNSGSGNYNFVIDQQPSTLNSVFPVSAISDALGNLLPQQDPDGDWWGGVNVDVAEDEYDHTPDASGTSWVVTEPLFAGPPVSGDQITFDYGDTLWFEFPGSSWIQYQDSNPVLLTWIGHSIRNP